MTRRAARSVSGTRCGARAPPGLTARSLQHAPFFCQARFKFLMAKVTPTLGRIHTVVEGECPSLEYRVRFLHDDGSGEVTRISPWHDVPYKNPEDGSYNMVVSWLE